MELNKIPFFYNVDNTKLNKVLYTIKSYTKNQTIYTQDYPCKTMDIVLSGNLIAYSVSLKGSESVVFEFNKNSVIGANLLFGNSNNYPMSIYCIENCKILHIKKSEIELLLKDPTFMMNFIKIISLNSQGMNKKIAMYTQKNLRENLWDYLHSLSIKQNSKTVTLDITKKQLADYFSVQRPSLFRELKKMKDEGLIEINNKQIKINKEMD